MSRRCELSGVGVQYGNKVSHSQRKTRRHFRPNLHNTTFLSDIIGCKFRLRINANCLHTVEKSGGFDDYMAKVSPEVLSSRAQVIQRQILKKKSEI